MLHNERFGALIVSCLVTLGRKAPRSAWVAAARTFSFTAAVRMVDRVHRDASVGGADAQPAVASGLADRDIFVIRVGKLPDGSFAARMQEPDLAAGHLDLAV